MARRRKIAVKKRSSRGSSKKNTGGPKKLMLAMSKLSSFKFNLKEVLEGVEGGDPVFANVLSKYRNLGFDDTRSYVEGEAEKGNLKMEKAVEVIDLMKKYSKYR